MWTKLKMKLSVFVSLLVIIPFQAEAGSCIGKNVVVWVANGKSLTGDGLLNPDPYVKVSIGDDTQKTKLIHGDANPSWWERLRFYRVTSDFMKIDIWESDGGVGNDDFLGTCLEHLRTGRQFRPIQCNANESGYVKLFYKCF